MKTKKLFITLSASVVLISCGSQQGEEIKHQQQVTEEPKNIQLDTIHLALDWSPNVLHSGIFYADHLGLFEENGIHLDWFTTEIDDYKKKPIQRLIDREVDLAIGPSEHLFFYGDTSGQEYAVALATILQKDQSAFVVKAERGINSPKDLDDHTYIGYKTPLEEEIITAMIKNDGGRGIYNSITPPRLTVWNSFLNDNGNAAWIFSHWEGAKAKAQGIELNYFYPNDFGVPYGYSSVIMANKKRDTLQNDKILRFLAALEVAHKKLMNQETDQVVEFLSNYSDHENFKDPKVVEFAWNDIKSAFLDSSGKWGRMEKKVWINYYNWISQHEVPHFNPAIKDVSIYFESTLGVQ
jgi:ABC-type nitrate/sulfonate/bicarbonate transport system substrate-binding protein